MEFPKTVHPVAGDLFGHHRSVPSATESLHLVVVKGMAVSQLLLYCVVVYSFTAKLDQPLCCLPKFVKSATNATGNLLIGSIQLEPYVYYGWHEASASGRRPKLPLEGVICNL